MNTQYLYAAMKEAPRNNDRALVREANRGWAVEYLSDAQAATVRTQRLRREIEELTLCCPEEEKLVIPTGRQAQRASMASVVAGGWVAVSLPIDGGYPALLPDSWTDGREIEPDALRKAWIEKYGIFERHLEDVLAKLETITRPAALVW